MLSKSAERSYKRFMLTVLFTVLFFLIVPNVLGDSRKVRSEGFDQSFKMFEWDLKLNNAVYNKDLQTLNFDFYKKQGSLEEKSNEPQIFKITLNAENSKELAFTSTPIKANSYGSRFTVANVPDDYYFVRVYIKVKGLDVQPEDYIDEFGNVITPPIVKGQEEIYMVNIDYRLAKDSYDDKPMITVSKPMNTDESDYFTLSPVTSDNSTSSGDETNLLTGITTNKPQYPIVTNKPDYPYQPSRTTTTVIPNQPTSNSSSSTTKPTGVTNDTKPTITTKDYVKTTDKPKTTTKKPVVTTVPAPTTDKPKVTTTVPTTQKPVTTTPTLPPLKVKGIKLQTISPSNNVILLEGEFTKVIPVITPNGATEKGVIWSSNKPDIAYVNSDGLVTARSPGIAIITATTIDGELSASCMITVK